MPTGKGTPTPWSYVLIRLLFRFVLKIFYGTIVIEGTDLIPETGKPCIVCANHSNSLTDALIMVTSVPSKKRNMLRMTAKASIFGQRNFSSWLIESTGTVPIKRRKDTSDGNADNSDVMLKLMETLEVGDAVCLFPEGISRFHPAVAPLKTGVARMVSDVLGRNCDDPGFELSVVCCSVTYMHRQHFRSDVLVTFHKPMVFSAKNNPELLPPVEFDNIRTLTSQLQDKISSGTLDAPTWDLIRTAKLAARMYAPLGTMMTLGDHVRLIRKFLDAFKAVHGLGRDESHTGQDIPPEISNLIKLQDDLKTYQDQLSRWGIKDDRIRRPLPRHTIFFRMLIRLPWSLFLFTISFPGLILWLPVFATTFVAVRKFKKTGPITDTWDEIAQYKVLYGLSSGICVWLLVIVVTWPMASLTAFLTPALMWVTLRWFEDAVAAFRAFTALVRLLCVGKTTLRNMHENRKDIHSRITNLAFTSLGLPENPETHFIQAGGMEKGRVRGGWDSSARYFSLKRRRKRDWNETLRLYDKVDFPSEDL